jgi:hypothetical protein
MSREVKATKGSQAAWRDINNHGPITHYNIEKINLHVSGEQLGLSSLAGGARDQMREQVRVLATMEVPIRDLHADALEEQFRYEQFYERTRMRAYRKEREQLYLLFGDGSIRPDDITRAWNNLNLVLEKDGRLAVKIAWYDIFFPMLTAVIGAAVLLFGACLPQALKGSSATPEQLAWIAAMIAMGISLMMTAIHMARPVMAARRVRVVLERLCISH